MTKHKIYVADFEEEGHTPIRFMEKGQRVTVFLPAQALRFLGLERDKTYQITAKEVEHEYI